MTQNMSSKMMQSYMIQNRVGVKYNTSATTNIKNIIIGAELGSNKNLLFSIGYDVYTSYYTSLLRSSGLTSTQKYNIQDTFYHIITDLSDDEEKQLGIYEETATDISNALLEYETSIIQNPDFTFYCTVYDNNKIKSLVINNMQSHFKLSYGKKYIFNLEDESNAGTTVSFSKQQQLFEDIDGIYRVGNPGESGACLVYIPELPSYYYAIHIYNKDDYTTGSFNDFGYIYKQLYLEYSYNIPYPNNVLFYNAQENTTKNPLFGTSILHTVENHGPKYILSSDASYTEIITSSSYTSYSWFNQISDVKKSFGMYYGYYTLKYRFNNNRIALINKGVNSYGISMENLIQVDGDESSVEVHYLKGLDETGELDGSYNFYNTPLTIKVLGDFEKCSLYTKILGYNKLEDVLFFDGEYANYSMTNPEPYQDISLGDNMIGLYPESEIYFHDISSDDLNLSNIYNDDSVNVDDRPRISLNYDGNSYDTSLCYGLYKGQYIIKNIPEDRPIAIINKDQTNSKEDCIKYFGPEQYKFQRLGPDGETLFDYYYHTLVIQVFGDFGKVSIYEYNDGFCGGENLLMYNESFNDISSEFQSWYELYEDASFGMDCSLTSISLDVSGPSTNNFTNIYQVESYINFDISQNSEGQSVILFDDINDSSTKYCFDTGNFVLMDVSSDNPIAFLNKGREDLFSYDGYYAYSTTGIAKDGNTYTYYSGNINITVTGDFGQLSFETFDNTYMGGFRKLMFNSGTKGYAVHHWGVNTYYDMLTTDSSDIPQNYYINVRTNTRAVHYSEDYVTYRFAGYDRIGLIDDEDDNPELTFAIGDNIYFTFDDNSEHPFGIYTYHNLLTDAQLITNNSNNTNSQIVWTPNLIVSNYYYYRAEKYVTNFMSNGINIINNEKADIALSISDIYTKPEFDISYDVNSIPMFEGTTPFSILLTSFNIDFDEVININSSRNLYLYNHDNDTIDFTIPATQLVKNAEENTITYDTGFSIYHANVSSLEFDTSYALLMDEELFENIYYNTISGEIETFADISGYNLLNFTTETRWDPPVFISINPDSSASLIDVSGYIEIEFDKPVHIPADNDVPGGNNIAFVDSDGNSINYTDDVSSGNSIFIYYSGLNYNTVYSVSFDDYSIVDSSNINFTITDSSLSDYSIQTIEDPRPQLQYFIPNVDIDVSDVYIDQPITLIFNETVYLDTSSNGQIAIKDGDSDFTNFNVSDNDDVSGYIFGSGTNTLRIYPFNADLSFSDNTTYTLSIDSDVIKDICDNYYTGITSSDSNPITFTTGDSAGEALESLTNGSNGNIVSDDSGDYIVFNNDTSYDSKQYTLSVRSYTIDISESYPFTILNSDISNIVVIGISNDEIVINVSGGSEQVDATTGDYFVFTNSDGETISLANGDFKFMRGQSYTFKGENISNNYEFVIYYGDVSENLSSVTTPPFVTFAIPEDVSTESNSLYYCAKYTTTTTINYDVSLTLLYSDVSEDNENGNGSYDFFYGNVTIDICSNDLGSFSFYTYNNGYMGGKYAFTFEDNYS